MNDDEIKEEALRRWINDGWLEQDFEEKGALYLLGVRQEDLNERR